MGGVQIWLLIFYSFKTFLFSDLLLHRLPFYIFKDICALFIEFPNHGFIIKFYSHRLYQLAQLFFNTRKDTEIS